MRVIDNSICMLAEDLKLFKGARLIHKDSHQILELVNGGEGIWRKSFSGHYTLRFNILLGEGIGKVVFQHPGEQDDINEYRLQISGTGIALMHTESKEEQVLACIEQCLMINKWYDICIYASRGWIRILIDGQLVLRVDDNQSVSVGTIVFSTNGEQKVCYSNIRWVPWPNTNAFLIQKQIDAELSKEEYFSKIPLAPVPKIPVTLTPASICVSFEIDMFNGSKVNSTINPGPLPPNYVHTWAVDVKHIDMFKLYFESSRDIMLDWDSGDRIKIYNSENKVIGEFSSLIDVNILKIKSKATQYDQGDQCKRIYIQLETSPRYIERHFVLAGLIAVITVPEITGSEEALLLADNIKRDPDNIGKIVETVDRFGKIISLDPPWKPHPMFGGGYPPLTDEWYQIGQFLKDKQQGFFTFAYYNEHQGRLRLYLYNYGLPDASLYSIKLFYMGRTNEKMGIEGIYRYFTPLKGAFFPVHPNPDEWSSVTIPVFKWSLETWTMVEVSMLYPMAENGSEHYHCIYEETFERNANNILFGIEVNSYLEGLLNADWIGKAVGEAIEKQNNTGGMSSLDVVKGIWEAFSKGKEWKSNAESLYKGVKEFYDYTKKQGGAALTEPSFKELETLISLGSSIWGIAGAAAGALFSLVTTFLGDKDKEPLQLSMTMFLRGVIHGTIEIPLQPRYCYFYLPGKFSINQAFCEGLPIYDLQAINSCITRYDRTMGLFGYKYNPQRVKFRVIRNDWDLSGAHNFFVLPAEKDFNQSVIVDLSSIKEDIEAIFKENAVIEKALPVIYNPFAEIIPMPPNIIDSKKIVRNDLREKFDSRHNTPEEWWIEIENYFDVSWEKHVMPEPDDKDFPYDQTIIDTKGPIMKTKVFLDSGIEFQFGIYYAIITIPEGFLIQLQPNKQWCMPSTFKNFYDITDISSYNYSYVVWNIDTHAVPSEDDKYSPFNCNDPFPIHDVIFYWDMPYFYYGRSRKKNGNVPRSFQGAYFISPITIDMIYYNYNETCKCFNLKERCDIKSRLLK